MRNGELRGKLWPLHVAACSYGKPLGPEGITRTSVPASSYQKPQKFLQDAKTTLETSVAKTQILREFTCTTPRKQENPSTYVAPTVQVGYDQSC